MCQNYQNLNIFSLLLELYGEKTGLVWSVFLGSAGSAAGSASKSLTPAEFQGEEELVFSEKAPQLLVLEHAESNRQLAALEVEGEGLRDAGVPLVYAEHAAERLRG